MLGCWYYGSRELSYVDLVSDCLLAVGDVGELVMYILNANHMANGAVTKSALPS